MMRMVAAQVTAVVFMASLLVANAGVTNEDGLYCTNGVCYDPSFSESPRAVEAVSTSESDRTDDALLLRDATAAFQRALAAIHDADDADRTYLALRMGGDPQACRAQGNYGKMMRIASAVAWAASKGRAVVFSDADNWVNVDPRRCAEGGLTCYVRAPDAGASGCGAALTALMACDGTDEHFPVTVSEARVVQWSACMHQNRARLGGPKHPKGDSNLPRDPGTNTWFGTPYAKDIRLPEGSRFATAMDAATALWPDEGKPDPEAAAAVERSGVEVKRWSTMAASQLRGGYDHAAGWLAGNALAFLLLGRAGKDGGIVGGIRESVKEHVAAAHAAWAREAAADAGEHAPCAAGIHVRRGDKYRRHSEDVAAFRTHYLPAVKRVLRLDAAGEKKTGVRRVYVATDSTRLARWIESHPLHGLHYDGGGAAEAGPRLRLLVAPGTPRDAWQYGRAVGVRYDVTREALGSLRDVLLLSECARVLGNPYSAFSQASAALAVYRRAAEGKRARVTWVPFPGIDRF